MFRRFVAFISREILSIHKAAYLIGLASLASVLLGLLRERLLVAYLGRGELLDVYYAAFKLPDLLFTVFISIISAFVLIPILNKKEDDDARYAFLDSLLSVFITAAFFVALAAFIFTPNYLSALFPSLYHGSHGLELLLLSRLFLLQFIFLGAAHIFMALLQFRQRFIAYAFVPLVYSLSIILSLVYLYPYFGVKGLAFGVVFGAFLQLVLSFAIASFVPRLNWSKINWKDIKDMLKVSYPRSMALFLQESVQLIIFSLLSFVSSGALSAFKLAYTLQAAPLSVIAVSYSVAAFPTLSRLHSKGDIKSFVEHVEAALRHILFWLTPIVSYTIVFRAHIVRIIYGTQNFTWDDTRIVAAVLAISMFTLLFLSISILLARAYYAAGMTKTPLLIYAASLPLLPAFYFLIKNMFIHYTQTRHFAESLLKVSGVENMSIVSMALAHLLTLSVSSILFMYLFRKYFMSDKKWQIFTISVKQMLLASVVSALFAKWLLIYLSDFYILDNLQSVILHMLSAFVPAAILFVLVLYVFDNLELRETLRILKHQWNQIRKKYGISA